MLSNNPSRRTGGDATTDQVDSGQLDIFAQVDDDPAPAADELSISERFDRFHAENPHIYAALVQLARRFVSLTGKRKLGAQRLIEIARWDMELATRGQEDFEINNSFSPYYARLIMLQEDDLAGLFELRVSEEADRWIAIRKHVGRRAA